jgi:EAL domain-containing protein (putative c-di-GMP-specific phosphodiesterase class I)
MLSADQTWVGWERTFRPRPPEAPLVPGLRFLFQPILSIGGGPSLHSLECLARGPRGSDFESADRLFASVSRRRLEPEMDRECMAVALGEAAHLPGAPLLSLNVHPRTLTDPGFGPFFLAMAALRDIPPTRLILEIVEQDCRCEIRTLDVSLRALRGAGVRIAQDDFGLGHSNFERLLALRPDFVKIDRHFVAGCDRDPLRCEVIDSLQALALGVHAEVIAEGVETAAEAALLTSLGVDLVQGFLFSPPLSLDRLRARPVSQPFAAGGMP